MNNMKQYIQSTLAMSVVAITPLIVHGADTWETTNGKLVNPLKSGMGIGDLVVYLVKDILVGLVAPIVITLALLWSGFLFVTAQGNEGKLETAKRNFLYVIVGGVLLLGAYVILDVVTNTVGEIIR